VVPAFALSKPQLGAGVRPGVNPVYFQTETLPKVDILFPTLPFYWMMTAPLK
jgi:hypothetical protein